MRSVSQRLRGTRADVRVGVVIYEYGELVVSGGDASSVYCSVHVTTRHALTLSQLKPHFASVVWNTRETIFDWAKEMEKQ